MTSQVMTSVVSSKKGSMYAVDGSGMRIMSEAWMPFQPASEEPSKGWPCSKCSSSKADTGRPT